jgi:hypothetical protein
MPISSPKHDGFVPLLSLALQWPLPRARRSDSVPIPDGRVQGTPHCFDRALLHFLTNPEMTALDHARDLRR